jgi:transcriptional regulator with XRE-family HTH domain
MSNANRNLRLLRQIVAVNLRNACQESGMNQREISEEMAKRGVTFSRESVSLAVNGKRGLDFALAYVLADVLGVSLEYLLQGSEQAIKRPRRRATRRKTKVAA